MPLMLALPSPSVAEGRGQADWDPKGDAQVKLGCRGEAREVKIEREKYIERSK